MLVSTLADVTKYFREGFSAWTVKPSYLSAEELSADLTLWARLNLSAVSSFLRKCRMIVGYQPWQATQSDRVTPIDINTQEFFSDYGRADQIKGASLLGITQYSYYSGGRSNTAALLSQWDEKKFTAWSSDLMNSKKRLVTSFLCMNEGSRALKERVAQSLGLRPFNFCFDEQYPAVRQLYFTDTIKDKKQRTEAIVNDAASLAKQLGYRVLYSAALSTQIKSFGTSPYYPAVVVVPDLIYLH